MSSLSLAVIANCDEATLRGSQLNKCPPPTPYIISAGYQAGEGFRGSGIRFQNVTIPKDSTINSAILTFTAMTNESLTTVNSRIYAEATDNPSDFSADTQGSFIARYSNPTTKVNWDNIGAWVLNSEYESPDIKAVIQAIVNRAGWVSGNALVIFWEDFDGRSAPQLLGRRRQGYPYNNTPAKATRLDIDYDAPPSGMPGLNPALLKVVAV